MKFLVSLLKAKKNSLVLETKNSGSKIGYKKVINYLRLLKMSSSPSINKIDRIALPAGE